MSKTLPLIAGLSILALAGAANAGGITLTANQMDKVTAGAAHNSNFEFSKDIDSSSSNNVAFTGQSKVLDVFLKKAQIDIDSHVKGNSASLGFDNEAVGKNSNVQGTLSQISVAGQGSSQSGLFVSAANGLGSMRGSR
jgi:hypothetical protein